MDNKFTASDLNNLFACVEQAYKNIGSSDDAKVLLILQNKIKGQLEAMSDETAEEVAQVVEED